MPGAVVTEPRLVGVPQWGSEAELTANQPQVLALVSVDIPCLWSIECVDISPPAPGDANFQVFCGMPSGVTEVTSFTTATSDDARLFIDEPKGRIRLVVWGSSVRVAVIGTLGGGKARVKVAPLAGDAASAAAFSLLQNPNKVAENATRSDVAQSAASVTLIPAANGGGSHRGCYIWNDAAANLRIRLGPAPATATDFSVVIPPQMLWEMPFPFYVGEIRGIWDAAGGGAARITQLKE